jgi:hypothetical protein
MRIVKPLSHLLLLLLAASCATQKQNSYFIVVGRVEHSKHRTLVYPRNLLTDKTTKHAYRYPFAAVKPNDTVLIHRNWITSPTFFY